MRPRSLSSILAPALAVALGLAIAAPVAAQESGPPPTPAPVPRTQSEMYVPLYGISAGIAIPAGRLGDDHAAGYSLGGLIEYAVTGQPYSLRGEFQFQRFPLKKSRTVGRDVNVFSLGPSVVYRLQQTPAETYLVGGIAVYNASDEGTRPGFNFGAGIGIPLTGFTALAEARMHVMLADGKPILTLPLTVGIRF